MSKKLTWKIERRKLSELKPLEKNPFGKSTPEKLERLKKKLDNLGVFETPTIDTDNNLLSFNKRHHALMTLWGANAEIDCMVPGRKLTESERKEIILASNAHEGEWDLELLREDFADIDLDDLGLNLDVMEFERSDHFDKAMKRFVTTTRYTLEAQEDNYDIPDEIQTDIVPGDLFEIGQHRLLCGDSTDSDAVAKLMDGEKADMVFTDPPYNIGFAYNKIDDKKTLNEYIEFCNRFLKNIKCEKIIITPGPKNLGVWYQIATIRDIAWWRDTSEYDAEDDVFELAVWYKKNTRSGASAFYLRQCEPIIFIGKFKEKRVYDFFDFKRIIPKEKTNAEKGLKNIAPAKPVLFVAEFIKIWSNINDLLHEPFTGSGTTMVAAHQLNRRCFGMELDPKYCQVIIDRMIKLDPEITIKRNGVPYDHNSRQLQQQPDADTSTPEITS